MGNKGGKAGGGPKPATIQKLVEATNFSAAEVSSLWNTFVSIKEEMEAGAGGAASAAAAAHGDLRISSAEFQAALGFRRGAPGGGESVFLGRIFGLFDENKDGYISFEEASAGCGGRICVRRCMGGGRSPRARGGARAVSGAAQWVARARNARAWLRVTGLLAVLLLLLLAVRHLHFHAHADGEARGARQAFVRAAPRHARAAHALARNPRHSFWLLLLLLLLLLFPLVYARARSGV